MRVVIVANGLMDDPAGDFARWVDVESVLVAADGGTHHLLACGLTPQHIIGDLDSLSPEIQADLSTHGVHFYPHPVHKDETDLELALLWAADQYPEAQLVLLGAMGGRPDQALANLLLLALPQLQGRDTVIAEGPWRVRLIRDGETGLFPGTPGDTLSLLPLGGPAYGVTTTGLAYTLQDETLTFGPARGVSNVLTAVQATVTVRKGLVWGFTKVGSQKSEVDSEKSKVKSRS